MRPKIAQSFHPHERTQTTTTGYIYILTNPSFPQYGKLGYATDVKQRLAELKRSTAVPFAFRVYATYEVDSALSDKKLHSILGKLNPDLRSAEEGVKPHQTFCHPCKRQIILHKRSPILPVNESDWKLFRKRLPEWQERCMEQLTESYAALLAGPARHPTSSGSWRRGCARTRSASVSWPMSAAPKCTITCSICWMTRPSRSRT